MKYIFNTKIYNLYLTKLDMNSNVLIITKKKVSQEEKKRKRQEQQEREAKKRKIKKNKELIDKIQVFICLLYSNRRKKTINKRKLN